MLKQGIVWQNLSTDAWAANAWAVSERLTSQSRAIYPSHVPSVELWGPDGYFLERLPLPFPMPSDSSLGSF